MAKRTLQPPSPAALRAHEDACHRGDRMYEDPDSGLYVMTSLYLASKEVCCGSGCRHCPFPEDAQRRANRPDVPAWPVKLDDVSIG